MVVNRLLVAFGLSPFWFANFCKFCKRGVLQQILHKWMLAFIQIQEVPAALCCIYGLLSVFIREVKATTVSPSRRHDFEVALQLLHAERVFVEILKFGPSQDCFYYRGLPQRYLTGIAGALRQELLDRFNQRSFLARS